MELLGDTDKKVRYNATSILARVAKAHPADVEVAIDPLYTLDDDFAYTRSNPCWALGYIKATQALEALRELADTDPEEEVRNAADWAAHTIEDT